jgi:hypothetical protein
LESSENLDLLFADLEYGVEAEMEDFVRRLLILLTDNAREITMADTKNNGPSTSSQQAKLHS